MITLGNFEDNLAWLKDCDWIIEAVTEDRSIKRALLEKVLAVRAPGTVVSSNTSGISIGSVIEGFGEELRRHFLGTHFFNPPRYLKLLEIIPTPETLPEVVEAVSRFGEVVLGKGIVIAKDTPNFIANRIGTFTTLKSPPRHAGGRLHDRGNRCPHRPRHGLAEIRNLPNARYRRPRRHGARRQEPCGVALPHDERRDLFQLPDFMQQMMQRRLLGDKTGQGFYKKVEGEGRRGRERNSHAGFQRPSIIASARSRSSASLEMARNIEDARERVRTLCQSPDRAGQFYQKLLFDTFHYAAMRVPEISDDIVSIDNSMKWGFNWECGVFELWDAVGMEKVVDAWKKAGRSTPPLVEKLLASGKKSFYAVMRRRSKLLRFRERRVPRYPKISRASCCCRRSKPARRKSRRMPAQALSTLATAWSASSSIPR